jgi:hypothetical protein
MQINGAHAPELRILEDYGAAMSSVRLGLTSVDILKVGIEGSKATQTLQAQLEFTRVYNNCMRGNDYRCRTYFVDV